MPQVAVAMAINYGVSAAFAGTFLVSAAGTLTFAGTIVAGALTMVANEALGFNDPEGGFEGEQKGRMQVVRSATDYHRYVYGESMVSGPLFFALTGSGDPAKAGVPAEFDIVAYWKSANDTIISEAIHTASYFSIKAGELFTLNGNTYTLAEDIYYTDATALGISNSDSGIPSDRSYYVIKATTNFADNDIGKKFSFKAYTKPLDSSDIFIYGYHPTEPKTLICHLPSHPLATNPIVNVHTGDTFSIVGPGGTYTLSQEIENVDPASVGYVGASVTVMLVRTVENLPIGLEDSELSFNAYVPKAEGEKSNEYVYLGVALAAHEVEEIGTVYFGEYPEYDEKFKDHYEVERHLGTVGQAASTMLMATFPDKWSSLHRLDGIAYIVVKLKHNPEVWTTGIPNIKVRVKGKKVYDPRTTTSYYSNNWALCARDYLVSEYGLGVPTGEVNDASVIDAANICEEWVTLKPVEYVATFDLANQKFTLPDEAKGRPQTGDRVRFTTLGTLPGGLLPLTDYYAIVNKDRSGFTVASSFANAMSRTAITLTNDAGSGTVKLVMKEQQRYTCDGTFDSSQKPEQLLEAMSTAGAGAIVEKGGVWYVYAGAYRTPYTTTLTANHLAGSIKIRPTMPRADLFNAVKGTYSSPSNDWQMSDFPMVSNATYQAQDGGAQITRDISLPFTIDVVRAQRIAKIYLERSRQAVSVDFPANISCLELAPMDNVKLTIPQLGFSEKVFQVQAWSLDQTGVIQMTMVEEAAAVYDWASGEESTTDLAPNTTLRPSWDIEAPTDLFLTERLMFVDGGYKTRITANWVKSWDARVERYNVQARVLPSGEWVPLSDTPRVDESDNVRLTTQWDNVVPGSYEVRVRGVTALGAVSSWISASITVVGNKGVMSTVGLPTPNNPKVKAKVVEGHVKKIKVTVPSINGDFSVIPEGLAIFVGVFDQPNRLGIVSGGTSGSLVVNNVDVITQGTLTVLSGSSRSYLRVHEYTNPLDMETGDYAKQFWAQYGASEWRKATSNDQYGFYFDDPFDVDPTNGQTINWAEIAWFDDRAAEFRYGAILAHDSQGNPQLPYEIVKWSSVDQVGSVFSLTGVQRGLEGTDIYNADGKYMYFYPAPGKGCITLDVPIEGFTQVNGEWVAEKELELDVPKGNFMVLTCCLYRNESNGFIRSNIVPMIWDGLL